MVSCPKCKDIEMDWEESDDTNDIHLSVYACPLCTLKLTVNLNNNEQE